MTPQMAIPTPSKKYSLKAEREWGKSRWNWSIRSSLFGQEERKFTRCFRHQLFLSFLLSVCPLLVGSHNKVSLSPSPFPPRGRRDDESGQRWCGREKERVSWDRREAFFFPQKVWEAEAPGLSSLSCTPERVRQVCKQLIMLHKACQSSPLGQLGLTSVVNDYPRHQHLSHVIRHRH